LVSAVSSQKILMIQRGMNLTVHKSRGTVFPNQLDSFTVF
jgi:hypothetical protein